MNNDERRISRRDVLAAGVTVGVGGIAGCTGEGGNGAETVTLVLTPAESEVEIRDQWQPFFDYVETEVDDIELEVDVASNFTAVAQALEHGQADIADASPEVGVYTVEQGFAEILGIRVAHGSDIYYTFVTSNPDSGIDELTDIEGGTIGLADQLSTAGSLVPLTMLADAGLDIGGAPDGDPIDFATEYSDHSQARETLIDRDEVVAAGTGAFATMPYLPEEEVPEEVAESSAEFQYVDTEEPHLQLVDYSDPLPRAPILVREDWESEKRTEIQDALLAADEDDLVDEDAEEPLWFTGLVEGDLEDYEPIVEMIDELGLDFSDEDLAEDG